MSIYEKIVLGYLGTSFIYGFYRSWSLPIWQTTYDTTSRYTIVRDITFRMGISIVNGIVYTMPPFSLIKYTYMGMRMYDVTQGYHPERFCKREHWKEVGFFHPRVI